ncbi:MAG: nucleoside hydrolase [Pseudomonadota bacterium]
MAIPRQITDRFKRLSDDHMRRLLEPPTGPVRMILDTDTANEIDDQFALAWALLSPDQIEIEGVTAEPYSFQHLQAPMLRAHEIIKAGGPKTAEEEAIVDGFRGWVEGLTGQGRDPRDVVFVPPDEGEQRSYDEILRVYDKLNIDPAGKVFHGSSGYLTSLDEPLRTPSAEFIIERALAASDRPLYVSAIGCVTNIASALLMAPEIIDNMVVLWTSGFPSRSHRTNEPSLNLVQDKLASQLLFECGVAHVYLPGYHIGAQLTISLPEMEKWLRGKGAIGDYLYHLYMNNPIHDQRGITGIEWRTWVIWDIINIAWLLNPAWVPTDLLPSPVLDDDLYWRHPEGRHWMREAYDINRDAIFHDFYMKLEKAP